MPIHNILYKNEFILIRNLKHFSANTMNLNLHISFFKKILKVYMDISQTNNNNNIIINSNNKKKEEEKYNNNNNNKSSFSIKK